MSQAQTIAPASTVALLRDGADGIETLLLRRSEKLAFAPGRWVFPGGRLDPQDYALANGCEEAAARAGAARESQEECCQRPDPAAMVLLSRWTTPEGHARRFSTYIFAAPLAQVGEVVVDGEEIDSACWLGAGAALQQHRAGELDVMPPTMITLRLLDAHPTVAAFLQAAREALVPEVFPNLCRSEAGLVSMYPGDAGYAAGDPSLPGARHRAVLVDGEWIYLHEGVDAAYPPLVP
ncbi:NUDIX hydrolase [Haliea sp. E17]|uniref:NUDIX hydrolase n=1 Tax=Haliea sp. E17 TaxID=3401576 RepID=UPI003AAB9E97